MSPLPENLRALQGPIASGILPFVLGAVGIVWLSIAAVESAAAVLGPVWAAAIVGALLLAPLAIIALMAWTRERRRRAEPLLSANGADAALATISAAAHKMIDKSPLAALALATLAGVMATRYPAGLGLLANVLSANPRA